MVSQEKMLYRDGEAGGKSAAVDRSASSWRGFVVEALGSSSIPCFPVVFLVRVGEGCLGLRGLRGGEGGGGVKTKYAGGARRRVEKNCSFQKLSTSSKSGRVVLTRPATRVSTCACVGRGYRGECRLLPL